MLIKQLSLLTVYVTILFAVGCSEYFSQYTRDENNQKKTGVFENATDTRKPSDDKVEYSRRQRYLVDTNDVLDITVFEEPELSMSIRVSDEGILSFPLIGDVKVSGLTTQAVEKTLEAQLGNGYLKNPKVTVRLDIELMGQYQEKEVFVLGEVKNPGALPILGKYMTVLEAVTKAGGFTEIAAPNRTRVIRVENGVEQSIKVNLNKVRKGDRGLDIILKPGDTINVPQTYF